jgi:hypothetical protein
VGDFPVGVQQVGHRRQVPEGVASSSYRTSRLRVYASASSGMQLQAFSATFCGVAIVEGAAIKVVGSDGTSTLFARAICAEPGCR